MTEDKEHPVGLPAFFQRGVLTLSVALRFLVADTAGRYGAAPVSRMCPIISFFIIQEDSELGKEGN